MVSPAMGAAMMGSMYFLRANCAQQGGSASEGGLICATLLSYIALASGKADAGYILFTSLRATCRRKRENRPLNFAEH